jgi:hypothetical protein
MNVSGVNKSDAQHKGTWLIGRECCKHFLSIIRYDPDTNRKLEARTPVSLASGLRRRYEAEACAGHNEASSDVESGSGTGAQSSFDERRLLYS